jgi:hypothetical protein
LSAEEVKWKFSSAECNLKTVVKIDAGSVEHHTQQQALNNENEIGIFYS